MMIDCNRCDGSGGFMHMGINGTSIRSKCPVCGGSGQVVDWDDFAKEEHYAESCKYETNNWNCGRVV